MTSTITNNRTFLIISIFIASFLVSCSQKVRFDSSNVVPAAEGYARIKKDNNSNYSIEVNIINLASSERLPSPKNAYVVWISTNNNGVKNIGQLKSSTGFFSKALEGNLSAVSSFKPNQVFVTAEDAANVQYPGPFRVLQTSSF